MRSRRSFVMSVAKCLSGIVSIGAAAWLLALAPGCEPDVNCGGCECDTEGCSSTTTGTDTDTTTSTPTPAPAFGDVCAAACACDPSGCENGGTSPCIQSFEDMWNEAKATGCEAEFGAAFTCF